MFIAMREASFEQTIGMLFNLEVAKPEPVSVGVVKDADGRAEDVLSKIPSPSGDAEEEPKAPLAKGLGGKPQENLTYSAPDESGEATTTRPGSPKKTTTSSSGESGGNRAARRKAAKRKR